MDPLSVRCLLEIQGRGKAINYNRDLEFRDNTGLILQNVSHQYMRQNTKEEFTQKTGV